MSEEFIREEVKETIARKTSTEAILNTFTQQSIRIFSITQTIKR